jgi:hypothetical protein
MKDPKERIAELLDRVETLESFVEEVREAVWEPQTTLQRLRSQVALALQRLNKGRME